MTYTEGEIAHIERMKTYNKDMAHLNLAMELFERVIKSNVLGADNIEGQIMMLLEDVRAVNKGE